MHHEFLETNAEQAKSFFAQKSMSNKFTELKAKATMFTGLNQNSHTYTS